MVTRRSEESKSVSRRRAVQEEDRPRRGRVSERSERRGSKSSKTRTTRVTGRGWGAVSAMKASRSGNANELKVPEKKKVLLHFMEAEPYDTWYIHWFDNVPQGTQKSYICLADAKGGTNGVCELCNEMGDEDLQFRAAFNVVDMSTGNNPKLQTWVVSPEPINRIEDAADDYGNIAADDIYFEVSRKKEKTGRWSYKLVRVKARDVGEDEWEGIDPLTDDDLDEFAEDMSESYARDKPEKHIEVLELME
jgi:hypothetical protein